MLYNLIIAPIETIVDWVFTFILTKFSSLGVFGALCGVSIVINFLTLPLYNIADALQEKERQVAKSLAYRVKRIKQAFKGDERFMMLATYYRQNNYHPLYALRNTFSILIQIPFFIAAFHYLSHCEALKGASFWVFKDLSTPDGLGKMGAWSINLLPIIMTLINIVSGVIYAKNALLKEKMQILAVSLIFLVLLYTSPSGLVLYWILNNVFSLLKNIVKTTPQPKKVFHGIVSMLFVLVTCFIVKDKRIAVWKRLILEGGTIFIIAIPYFASILKKKFTVEQQTKNIQVPRYAFGLLFLSGLGLALLCGLLLPASTIATSPREFSFLGETDSPLTYIYYSLSIFMGFFLFWPVCLYKLFGHRFKKAAPLVFFVLFSVSLANAYIFKSSYGILLPFLGVQTLRFLRLPTTMHVGCAAFAGLVIIAVYALKKIRKIHVLNSIVFVLCLSELGLGLFKTVQIQQNFADYAKTYVKAPGAEVPIQSEFHLSKTHKNVVVLFLDRAMGHLAPKIFEQFPNIRKQFRGFTYYANTVSFAPSTIGGSPAMMGGYEYSIDSLNARSQDPLVKKHNEALLVMPKLFADAGFTVSVFDPPLSNHQWKGDLTPYQALPNVTAKELLGKYLGHYIVEKQISTDFSMDKGYKPAFIDFSILQILVPALRETFYRKMRRTTELDRLSGEFFESLAELYFLPKLTDFDAENDTYTFMGNDTTHDLYIKLANNYESLDYTSRQKPDAADNDFQANIAAYKQIGKWLDFLQANGVYDNTRIIIVSDHGGNSKVFPHDTYFASWLNPLLLVKDFSATGSIKTDLTFMTNADTVFLAKEGLNVSSINPFTQKVLQPDKDSGVSIYPAYGKGADSTQFAVDRTKAYHISGDIFDAKNWVPLLQWEQQQKDLEKQEDTP